MSTADVYGIVDKSAANHADRDLHIVAMVRDSVRHQRYTRLLAASRNVLAVCDTRTQAQQFIDTCDLCKCAN